jgi:hypothetical protein
MQLPLDHVVSFNFNSSPSSYCAAMQCGRDDLDEDTARDRPGSQFQASHFHRVNEEIRRHQIDLKMLSYVLHSKLINSSWSRSFRDVHR